MARILIDALGWTEHPSGLSTYCYCIMKELTKANVQLHFTVLHNVVNFKDKFLLELKNKNFTFIYLDKPLLSIQKELHFLFNKKYYSQFDLFYSMSSYAPVFQPNTKFLSTTHDLKYVEFPELIGKWKSILLSKIIKKTVMSADSLIMISNFTKNQVRRKFKIKSPVDVIYEGPSRFISAQIESKSKLFNTTREPGPYFLSIAENRPHKNLELMLRAFKIVVDREKIHGIKFVLVGSGVENLRPVCEELELEKNVLLAGKVSDMELRTLLAGAKSLVFPSLYEGFGIPLVDAMYFGVPIITSNITSTCEIAKDVAILIDPRSKTELANAMSLLINDKKIWNELSMASLKASTKFDWQNCSNDILKIILNILDKKL